MEPTLIVNMSEIVALEAITPQEVDVNPDTSMKISLVTDKMIEKSNLGVVTSPIIYSSGLDYNDEGLFSRTIFGTTIEELRRRFAYIDLHGTFFHPFVYEMLVKLDKRINECAAGNTPYSWVVTDGELVRVPKDNPLYNEDNMGLQWLISHFKELDFKKNKSITRNDRVNLIDILSEDEIFISKWLVIPVFYRDIDNSEGKRSVPKINDEYTKLIQYSNAIADDDFGFYTNSLYFNIQKKLVEIRKYGQSIIEKKHGIIHRSVLGKSVDRGSRDVISVPIMNNYDKPNDNPVDIFHTGIPLEKCLVLGYNYVLKYIKDFIENNFRNLREYPIYDNVNGRYEIIGHVDIKNQVEIYNDKFIDKKIKRYMKSPGTRFEPVTIVAKGGQEIPIRFVGLMSKIDPDDPKTITGRYMTWTDLFYMACADTLTDKYVYITRYPITSYASTFATLCTPLATLKTVPMNIGGKEYPHYPYIDLSLSNDKISTQFVGTVTISNLFLDIIGGDFDGDQTSEKMCFTLEANEEAKKITTSIKNFVTPDGKFMRLIKNESNLTFFNMTRL